MRFSKAPRSWIIAETLAITVCFIALPTATEQQSQQQQQWWQTWRQYESSFELVLGVCNSTTLAVMAAAPRSASERVICCDKIGYRLRPSSRQSLINQLSDYRCCYNDSRWADLYNPKDAMCCGGRVMARDPSGDQRCCNGEALYNVSTHICCVDDGLNSNNKWQIHIKPSFAELHHFCCGKELYNNLTQKCCSSVDGLHNSVHILPEDEAQEIVPKVTACCGTATYKTTSELVCHGDDLINEAILCANSQKSERLNDSHICCSGPVASDTGHTCCEGVLHRLSDRSRCCGSHYVNENEYLCCNGTAYPRHNSEDLACCGSSLFNQSTHRCYDNKVLINYHGPQAIRCGEGDKAQFIDRLKHICCNGKGFLRKHYLCCSGTLYDRSDLKNESCCGLQKYNTATHTCTEAMEVRHGAEEVTECQSVKYSPHEYICCDDRLLPRKNGNKCCGKKNYFEYSWARCCNGKLMFSNKKTAFNRCSTFH